MKYPEMNNFDRNPAVPVAGYDGAVCAGFDAIRNQLRASLEAGARRVCFELYPGVDRRSVFRMLEGLRGVAVLDADVCVRPRKELARRYADHLTDDRVFGVMCCDELSACLSPDAVERFRRQLQALDSPAVVVGTGACLCMQKWDALWYWDITRWEIQLRYRRGQGNWILDNADASQLSKYKCGYFIEWRMADRLKESLFGCVDYWVDAHDDARPVCVAGKAFEAALETAARRPVHMRPYYDPSVWGGQWMKHVMGLDPESENYGWSFDGVPEENSISFDFGGTVATFPAMNLVLRHPKALLGERVYGRFGSEFPIRFDLLDTFEGGNLSLQVHPLTTYIQRHFGMHYTQDESYYILDASEDSCVYLGVKPGVSPEAMRADLEAANRGERLFPAENYVNRFPVRRHDHVLIPAGTVHCSGANTMVLEISATPYIFTFKMWDWGRVGLDGLPRPVHIDHAMANIQFDRDTDWVRRKLLRQDTRIQDDEDGLVEETGLHPLEFIRTRRATVRGCLRIDPPDTVTVLNLVEGAYARIESPEGSFPAQDIHYAETFILPAAAGPFVLRKPSETDGNVIFILADIR